MKKPTILIALILVSLQCAISTAIAGQPSKSKAKSPEALIADLYKTHDQKRGPFFQTKNRSLLDKYFVKSLADLIWKDRVTSTAKNEVGVIDGDPLYNAQDMEIKKFAIGTPTYAGGKARVNVTFENFGQPKTVGFMLVKTKSAWLIDDIDYGADGTLRGWFKEARTPPR